MLSEKISYFVIAFSVYLLGKALLFFHTTPLIFLIFDIAMAISLLCSNVPRVLAVPLRMRYYMHKVEYIAFGIAIMALFMMFVQ